MPKEEKILDDLSHDLFNELLSIEGELKKLEKLFKAGSADIERRFKKVRDALKNFRTAMEDNEK